MSANSVRKSRPLFEQGFTLIELMVVITVIGILAAVALPRLIDAQRDARVAKAHAIYGNLRSATALARARCELDIETGRSSGASANCASVPPKVQMDGTLIDIVHRHPAATANGIDAAADLNLNADKLTIGADCSRGWRCFDVVGGTTPNCRIIYQEATLAGTMVVSPVVTVVTNGC